VTNLSFSYTLPAMSIVTFVGIATNHPPTLTPVQNQIVNAGVTVVVTNVASDVDAPPQTLTFNLLSAPSGASLNSSNGVFSWRPPVSSANTTNPVLVQVINNGTPVLGATNQFTIAVNPLELPVITSISVSASQAVLMASGTLGPDYSLWASTNLVNWQIVVTSNSPALPVTLVDTNSYAYQTRFYRVQIGP